MPAELKQFFIQNWQLIASACLFIFSFIFGLKRRWGLGKFTNKDFGRPKTMLAPTYRHIGASEPHSFCNDKSSACSDQRTDKHFWRFRFWLYKSSACSDSQTYQSKHTKWICNDKTNACSDLQTDFSLSGQAYPHLNIASQNSNPRVCFCLLP